VVADIFAHMLIEIISYLSYLTPGLYEDGEAMCCTLANLNRRTG